MKKTLLSLLCLLAVAAQAQAVTPETLKKFWTETRYTLGAGSHHRASSTLNLDLGFYVTGGFQAFAHIEGGQMLHHEDDVRTFVYQSSAGGGLGYQLLTDEKTNTALSVRGMVAGGIHDDWHFTLYDAGVYLHSTTGGKLIGVGYRRYDSHGAATPSLNVVYVSLGFRF